GNRPRLPRLRLCAARLPFSAGGTCSRMDGRPGRRAGRRTAMTTLLSGLLLLTPLAPPPAGAGPPDPAASPELRREAQEFARELLQKAEVIRERYVRPLDRTDLLAAGVAALYEAVHRPVPAGLRDQIARADEF